MSRLYIDNDGDIVVPDDMTYIPINEVIDAYTNSGQLKFLQENIDAYNEKLKRIESESSL